ncbi:hypothetical protein [Bailinhaonella thermotolerans]|uniref:Uncharacterized protein n=1 Tax=Bailinhaonella thermotolerans TaxID=1070861 RepID=A0A3A4AY88_9ACTN|nr:hypothetical protein [Bailinhaonella thermotolerans]RJL30837.1 hypothetical protein D5H75_21250 [Bailinhaonella thermotolerans]
MTLASEVKKITESKPFYAAAGIGDLAVEKLRELPDRLAKLPRTREQIRAEFGDLPETARRYTTTVTDRAGRIYEDLAARGKDIVERVNRQAATQQLEASAKSTARKAGATAEEAKTTAKTAGKAVKAGASKVGD